MSMAVSEPGCLRSLKRIWLFFLILPLLCKPLKAQDSMLDSAASRSFAARDTIKSTAAHSVRKATLFSALLPGAGQVYNKKIWKVPVIYAAFAGMTYLIRFNNENYKKFENALLLRYDEDPNTVDEYAEVYSDDNLRSLSDFYRRNRDLSVIGLSAVYVLNIIDAHVDAHLFTFNVDDNLSFNWSPQVQHGPGHTTPGIHLSLNF